MRIVLDTNIFIVSLPSISSYHYIFDSLVNKKFELIVSNPILLEYEEIIQRKFGEKASLLFNNL